MLNTYQACVMLSDLPKILQCTLSFYPSFTHRNPSNREVKQLPRGPRDHLKVLSFPNAQCSHHHPVLLLLLPDWGMEVS